MAVKVKTSQSSGWLVFSDGQLRAQEEQKKTQENKHRRGIPNIEGHRNHGRTRFSPRGGGNLNDPIDKDNLKNSISRLRCGGGCIHKYFFFGGGAAAL